MSAEKQPLKYAGIAMGFLFLLFIFAAVKTSNFAPRKVVIEKVAAKVSRRAPARTSKEELYDISKIKGEKQKIAKEKIKSMGAVYENYPAGDVGVNVIKEWSKANPKDKAAFMEGLDKTISGCSDKLKSEPDNKKAKRLLAISLSLKKMALNNFDYKAEK